MLRSVDGKGCPKFIVIVFALVSVGFRIATIENTRLQIRIQVKRVFVLILIATPPLNGS